MPVRTSASASGATPSRSDCPNHLRMQGHPSDFFDGGGAAFHQVEGRQAQAAGAVGGGRGLDAADRLLVDDQLADLVVQGQDLGNRTAALVAGAAAVAAALPAHE